MSLRDAEEEAGLPAAASVDEERWHAVWGYRPCLLKIARQRTSCEEDAEDVVAEALLRAVRSSRFVPDRGAAWLMTATARLCVDAARERARDRRAWARIGLPAAVASFEQRVCDQAEASWMAARMGQLPHRQAEALRLRAEGLPVSEVAQRLGVTYRTAESLLARARTTLRSLLLSTTTVITFVYWALRRSARTAVAPATVASSALTLAVVLFAGRGHGVVASAGTVPTGRGIPVATARPAPPRAVRPKRDQVRKGHAAPGAHRPPPAAVQLAERSRGTLGALAGTPQVNEFAIPQLPVLVDSLVSRVAPTQSPIRAVCVAPPLDQVGGAAAPPPAVSAMH